MNRRAIAAIVRKDLVVVVQSKAVMIPLLIVPLVFFVGLPLLAGLGGPALINVPGGTEQLMASLPEGLRVSLDGLDETQQLVVLLLVYFFVPMFLIVPLMVATVIAADSFAGEKERKTLEALLYSPVSDRELLVAKLLSAWLLALAVGLVGFIVYALAVNLSAWGVMGRVFFPTWMWFMLVIWVMPAVAGMGLGVSILVSARVKSFQEAYQLGAVVVLPMLLLVVAQVTGVMILSTWLVFSLGVVLWGVTALLLYYGCKGFKRSEMIARL
jgi:ABC-2 type transport system permease protein